MNLGLLWCFDFPLSSLVRFPLWMCLKERLLLLLFSFNLHKPVHATLPAWRKVWEDSGGAFPQAGQGSVLLPACLQLGSVAEGSLCALPQVLLLCPARASCFSGTRVNEWDRFLFRWLLHGEWAALHWLGKDAVCKQRTSVSYADAPENIWWMEDGFILLSIKGEVFPAVA